MRKWLILLSALSATSAIGAPAWTWVDSNGQVHFSDRPVPGARQVELQGAQGFGSPAPTTRSAASAAATPAAAVAPYETVEVVRPTELETLWNIGGTLSVQVRFAPALAVGHRFDLALDGARRNLNSSNPSVTLTDVFRGSHTLQVIVLDATGTELMRSPVRNFVVQQTSVQNPNSPLARPPGNGGN